MLLEVWRIHPDKMKDAADIELHNSLYPVIHPAYSKRTIEINPDDYWFHLKPKELNDHTWIMKSVHEMVLKSNPNVPSIFIRRPLFLQLQAYMPLSVR